MGEVREHLVYTRDHEWIRLNSDGSAVIGVTDHAQSRLGELVYVELPQLGHAVSAGDSCAVVESVKAASDVYAPLSGQVTAVNENLNANPELVNSSPYEEGWIFRITPVDSAELDELLDAGAYRELLEEER